MKYLWSRCTLAITCAALQAMPAIAQSVGTVGQRTAVAVAPTFSTLSFSTPLPLDSGTVREISQLLMPVSARFQASSRIVIDLSAAYVSSTIKGLDSLGKERTLSLAGPADVRARAVVQLVRDNLLFSALVNLPTGLTSLDDEQEQALRAVGAPVLRPPVGLVGLGFGANAGLVYAFTAGRWNWALGGSYEQRGKYSPVEATLYGTPTTTNFSPGSAVRASVAMDRIVGEGRFALHSSAEFFQRDSITLTRQDSDSTGQISASGVRLGPQITIGAQWEPGLRRVHASRIYIQHRTRLPFTNTLGEKQESSLGQTLDAGVSFTIGSADKLALVLQGAGRFDSGLEFDKTLLTASATDFIGSLGVRFPARTLVFEPRFSLRAGNVDVGPVSSALRGTTFGVVISNR